MKQLLIISLIIAAGAVLPLASQEKDVAKEVSNPVFLPKPLDDDWTRWIVGEWEGSGESDAGKGKFRVKAELDLNGQFLIMKGQAEITEISSEYLKDTMNATDEELEKFQGSVFKSLQLYTIDPKTGEIIGYLFDSLRCIATGRGKRDGNKEIMEWQWSGNGQGTSIGITEKVDNDKLIFTEKYTLPDGSIMEDKGQMTRCKKTAISRDEQK